jgi:hypothetical protein
MRPQPETTPKLLVGVEAIAHFVFGDATASNVRRARHWIDTGQLPAGKICNRYVADPDLIARRLAEVAGGAK